MADPGLKQIAVGQSRAANHAHGVSIGRLIDQRANAVSAVPDSEHVKKSQL